MKVLITGPQGQVGWELLRAFPDGVEVRGIDRTHLDLLDHASIRRTIDAHRPDVIINAAAYTAVDRAEAEESLATAINGEAVGVIGEEARRVGAAVVHYSTDYVFDGAKTEPYLPSDAPNPLSAYGRSKLAGERALAESGAAHLIFRTCWVYGLRGRNFLLTMLRMMGQRAELKVVNDQIGCPTWSRTVAQVTAKAVCHGLEGSPGERHFGGHEGVHHIACDGCTTWFGFAQRIFELADAGSAPNLVPISSTEYPTAATRPAYSALDCTSTRKAFGVHLPSWQDTLEEVLRERLVLTDTCGRIG